MQIRSLTLFDSPEPSFGFLVHLRIYRRGYLVQSCAQLFVGCRVDLSERRCDPVNHSLFIDDEDGSVVDKITVPALDKGAVGLANFGTRVTGKQELELIVPGPLVKSLSFIRADAYEDNVLAAAKQTCVLITVRLHLNRSARRPDSVKKGEYNGFAPEVT